MKNDTLDFPREVEKTYRVSSICAIRSQLPRESFDPICKKIY